MQRQRRPDAGRAPRGLRQDLRGVLDASREQPYWERQGRSCSHDRITHPAHLFTSKSRDDCADAILLTERARYPGGFLLGLEFFVQMHGTASGATVVRWVTFAERAGFERVGRMEKVCGRGADALRGGAAVRRGAERSARSHDSGEEERDHAGEEDGVSGKEENRRDKDAGECGEEVRFREAVSCKVDGDGPEYPVEQRICGVGSTAPDGAATCRDQIGGGV
jgi:hypothetical protein